MGWEKVACWSTKAAISLKRVKIEEKLLWSANALSNGTIPTPYGLPFPRLGVRNLHPNIQSLLSEEQITDIKFGPYIHRVHPNKRPSKILEKRERGRIQGLPKVLKVPPIMISRKATNLFCTHIHIHTIDRNKSPLKIRIREK